ncbi:hypothetical protein COO60DRAFT_1462569 [Scenedesmus sp. NREL 46B-D3]|nr:hypothetical protein COO60DRAFT_1462569 [Scenedesmus sp. NREL 46B-D3]
MSLHNVQDSRTILSKMRAVRSPDRILADCSWIREYHWVGSRAAHSRNPLKFSYPQRCLPYGSRFVPLSMRCSTGSSSALPTLSDHPSHDQLQCCYCCLEMAVTHLINCCCHALTQGAPYIRHCCRLMHLEMMPSLAVRAMCALLLCLSCIVAAGVNVAGHLLHLAGGEVWKSDSMEAQQALQRWTGLLPSAACLLLRDLTTILLVCAALHNGRVPAEPLVTQPHPPQNKRPSKDVNNLFIPMAAGGWLQQARCGNTISSGLVLMAAHCVAPADFLPNVLAALRENSGYPPNADPCNIAAMPYTINDILACYNYDNRGGVSDVNRCLPDDRYIANGFSWFNRDGTLPISQRNFDHAIVFLSRPRMLPSYYQYNYLDNPTTPVNVENWSYIGGDCATCNVECWLSRMGPAQGPNGNTLGTGPNAIRMPLTSLPGNSGSCAVYSPDGCCIAVSSFALIPGGTCGVSCNNYWSPIMSTRPLANLWERRMRVLPNAAM